LTYAHGAFEGLADVGELVRIESGTREGLIGDFKKRKYDGVVAIWWTFDSSKVRFLFFFFEMMSG